MDSVVFSYWLAHNCHHVIIHFLTPRIYFRTHCLFKHGSFVDPYAIFFFYLLQIAITGKSFCRASAIATELIISNILRIGRVNVIGDVILYLGKLCVSLSSALFAFLMLDTHKYRSSHNKISSPLLPVLVCGLIPSQTSRYSNSCTISFLGTFSIETSDSKCLYLVRFCTCAGLLGSRLCRCDSLLCRGGDVN